MAHQTNAGTCEGHRGENFVRHAMDAHGGAVYLVALAQARSEADAQDVAQDVFCRLLTSNNAFTSDEHLRAWLLRVTLNRCRELHRAPWRRRVDSADELARELPSPDVGTEDAALAELRADPVWQALRQLPEKLREVALLHYVEEYTTEQAARIVGSPPATVRTRPHRTRKQMRQILAGEASAGEAPAGRNPASEASADATRPTDTAKEKSYGSTRLRVSARGRAGSRYPRTCANPCWTRSGPRRASAPVARAGRAGVAEASRAAPSRERAP